MVDRKFHYLDVNGVTLRTVVEGDGPLVVLLHGWPQGWYLWRNQIDGIVRAGYRVAVPDLRGFGGSSCPVDPGDYNMRLLADDIAGIATALGEDRFVTVGHDWGCVVAWYVALYHPMRCRAVLGMSVPFWKISPDIAYPNGYDDAFWYFRYVIENPGAAAEELDANPRDMLLGHYYTVSGEAPVRTIFDQLRKPRAGTTMHEAFPVPARMPDFLKPEDLDYMVEQYRTSGFHGNLNFYRNSPNILTDTADVQDKQIEQPAGFVCGAGDPTLLFPSELFGLQDWRSEFEAGFTDLRFVDFIPDAGHWPQIEQPERTTRQMLRFLEEIDRASA